LRFPQPLDARTPRPRPMPRHKFTSDEQALLAACLAAPADSAPWLVYADWLQDRGNDPGAVFVRAIWPAVAEASRLQPLWRTVTQAMRHAPTFEKLRRELVEALAAAARLAYQRPAPERCRCGRPARIEWRPCGECGAAG
jgi:uncharacterized protein (TIGR02996 family)